MSNPPDSQSDIPVPRSILLLLGPLLIGSLTSSVLFGISIVQLYLYNLKFSSLNDKFLIRFSVYMVFTLDVFLTVATWALAWHVLCSGWGRISALIYPGWTLSAIPVATGILSAWVQTFYAWRIHMMIQWKVIPIVIIIVSVAEVGAAITIGITIASIRSILHLHHLFPITIVWLSAAVLADMIISISMVYILYFVKKRTFARMSTRHTEKVINRLIRSTVETGIVTSVCVILELIFFLSIPKTNIHLMFLLMSSKLYSNALMTSLNSRRTGSSDNLNTEGMWNSFGTLETSHGGFAHTNTVDISMDMYNVTADVELSDQPKKQDYEDSEQQT